ncbi:MAG: hypothetical protein J4203_05710 [Candidatus Diapherotrites archaeon]|uniref:CARDB domain-containing protein n=2 Tax=Candidatus Iainarchaeum sp. TaxID=3101447 RepID=A0A8T4LFJ0_9ARCH|nr:hypothetical protein [Candidatus Diapherotrites archaeon]
MDDLRELTGSPEKNDFLPVLLILALVVLVGFFLLTTQPAQPVQPPAAKGPEPVPGATVPPSAEEPKTVAETPAPVPEPVREQPRPQPRPEPRPAPEQASLQADLVVDAINILPQPVTLKAFPVAVKYSNAGTGNAAAFQVNVEVKNKKEVVFTRSFSLEGLGAKASAETKFELSLTDAGDYALTTWVDAGNGVSETSEANNEHRQVFHVYGEPDLVISFLDVEPNPPAEMQETYVSLRVKNISPLPAPKGTYVRLELPNADTRYFVLRIPQVLQAEQEYEFPKMRVRFSGNYAQINALVDSTGVLHEDNEANNEAHVDVNPSIPDVEIDGVRVSGPSELSVKVANNSNAYLAEKFRVFLKADDLLFGGVDNTSFLVAERFDPGQVIEYKVRNISAARKPYTLYVVADPDAQVLEGNENNNTVKVQVQFPQ